MYFARMKNGFGQFCPLAMACEVFAARWTPIILRELFAGSHRFNEIHRDIPLISRTLLVKRLRELEAAGVIASVPGAKGNGREYHLTEAGEEFRAAIAGLATWGQRWTDRAQPRQPRCGPAHVDPAPAHRGRAPARAPRGGALQFHRLPGELPRQRANSG